jgi:hypothetical protein
MKKLDLILRKALVTMAPQLCFARPCRLLRARELEE